MHPTTDSTLLTSVAAGSGIEGPALKVVKQMVANMQKPQKVLNQCAWVSSVPDYQIGRVDLGPPHLLGTPRQQIEIILI